MVATDSEAVATAVEKAGGRAVMTRSDHQSGSDRINEALEALDPERQVDIVVNVQGDLPTIDPAAIRAALKPLDRSRRRYRDARRGDSRSGRTDQSERGQGARDANRARPAARDAPSRAPTRKGPGRTITTSGFTPIAARRLSALWRCRRPRTRSASGSSSCARSMPACASTSRSWTPCRSASTRRRIWTERARCSRG